MFGTLKLRRCDAPELYGRYKEYYCGLCTLLASEYGQTSRLLLNYDITFFYLLLSAVGKGAEYESAVCPLAPHRPRSIAVDQEAGRLAAAAHVYMAGLKLRDDIRDGASPMRKAAYRFLAEREARAALYLKERGFRIDRAEQLFREQNDRERQVLGDEAKTLPYYSNPTEEGTRLLFSDASRYFGLAEHEMALFGTIGGALGRIAYIMDSFVDYPEDLRCGRFNALAKAFGDKVSLRENLDEAVKKSLLETLSKSIDEVEYAVGLLELDRDKDLVDAVIASLRRRVLGLVQATTSLSELEERVRKSSFSYRLTHPQLMLKSRAAYRRREYRGNGCCDDICTAWICCDAADCDCDTAEGCAQGDCCEFMECCG